MGAKRTTFADAIVPSKEPSVTEQPLLPAVVTPAVDQANPVG